MNKTFFGELLETSRLLTVLYDNLPEEMKANQLFNKIESYLEKYARFNAIAPEKAVDIYTDFITNFNKHCKQFIKTGKYPIENGINKYAPSREEYDVVLLLSVLFTPHRFRIMELLRKKSVGEKALFIGLGPGLELYLTKENYEKVEAYDLSINEFLREEFPAVSINKELYVGQKENYFDAVYLIEILEHLENPFVLLEVCKGSMKQGGKIYLTTATDIPQFDHLYNFAKDHSYFEERIKEMGFSIAYKEMIAHNYLIMELKPCNHFYILTKN